jgi:uncharacterized metal-binding protein YceD (DUF177 family)
MSEAPSFSRMIDLSAVPATGVEQRIEASAAERAVLAEEFDLLGIDSLAADVAVVPWQGDGFTVTGHVTAQITQRCVVSLVPVEQTIDEPFEVHLVPAGSRLAAAVGKPERDIVVQVSAEEPPEVFSGHMVDLGSIVTEHFALAIDPYPRAPGAELPSEGEAGGPGRSESPFAVLAKLKKQGG